MTGGDGGGNWGLDGASILMLGLLLWRGKAEHCLAREAEQRRLRFGVSSVVVRDVSPTCMLSITKNGMKWVRGAKDGGRCRGTGVIGLGVG